MKYAKKMFLIVSPSFIAVPLAVLARFLFANVAVGADAVVPMPGGYEPMPGFEKTVFDNLLLDIICQVAFYAFYILIPLTIVFVVIAAYKYLTSSGDPEKVKSATKTITYAAVAIVVALLARVFPILIVDVFGPMVSGGGDIESWSCF